MQEILWKKDILKEDYQKALRLTSFFLSNPASLNGKNYQKQKGPGTSNQSLFRLRNKFRKILVIKDVSEVLSDQI